MGPLDAVKVLHAASAALLSQGALHGKLAGLDLQEEKNRVVKMLVALLLGIALGSCALLFAGALVVVATWDTGYRVAAVAAFALAAAAGAIFAWRWLHALSRAGDRSFAASREEFAADAALLRLSL